MFTAVRRFHEEVEVHETEIVSILKQADTGIPVKELCRQAGIGVPPLLNAGGRRRDYGLPQVRRTDNGPEFLGENFVQRAKQQGMAIPVQPAGQAQPERLHRTHQPHLPNRTFREEVLDAHLFARIDDVREAAWWGMIEYNQDRPHHALGDLTPAGYRQQAAKSSTLEVPA